MTDFDPTNTAQQDADHEKAAAHAALVAKQEAEDFQWLMADQRGRRIVWRLLAESRVFHSSFDPMAMNMAFNEGRRAEGLRLLGQVHALCPDLYPTMMKENT
jgi:hypothetical protein